MFKYLRRYKRKKNQREKKKKWPEGPGEGNFMVRATETGFEISHHDFPRTTLTVLLLQK